MLRRWVRSAEEESSGRRALGLNHLLYNLKVVPEALDADLRATIISRVERLGFAGLRQPPRERARMGKLRAGREGSAGGNLESHARLVLVRRAAALVAVEGHGNSACGRCTGARASAY